MRVPADVKNLVGRMVQELYENKFSLSAAGPFSRTLDCSEDRRLDESSDEYDEAGPASCRDADAQQAP